MRNRGGRPSSVIVALLSHFPLPDGHGGHLVVLEQPLRHHLCPLIASLPFSLCLSRLKALWGDTKLQMPSPPSSGLGGPPPALR